ncbi:MAG: hypothetical protein U0556_04740 [Dehalococcoidia bacterium]
MTASNALSHVFQPFDLGGLTLKNRIFISGHAANFGENTLPTDRDAAHHASAKVASG